MAFTLPDLPFAHDALAVATCRKRRWNITTTSYHKAYVDNLNKPIAKTEWEGNWLRDIVTGTLKDGAVAQNGIFNNASQHWNHSQFWEMMGPKSGAIPGALEAP